MRLSIGLLLAAFTVSACEPPKETLVEKDEVKRPISELRLRLLEGLDISRDEIQVAGEVFGGQLKDLTLAEAKECRVGLYTQSRHFNSGDPTEFTVDFTQPDRDAMTVNQMAFAYTGFDEAVRYLEVKKVRDKMSDAPESVKKQIIREGGFHKSVVGLARCKSEEMIPEDDQIIYFQIFCRATGKTKRRQQYQTRAKMSEHCNLLVESFLKIGEINPSLLENTPMR